MKRVVVADLEPGMVLAQDIVRQDGMKLAGQGTSLTPGIINMIAKMVEVEAVLVEGSAFDSPEEAEAWKKEEAKKLVHRFKKVAGDPFMDRLKRLEAKRILESV